MSIRATSLTSGSVTRSLEEFRKNYRWHGVEPGDPQFAEEPPVLSPALLASTDARKRREAEFARLRGEGKSITEAGRAVGVGYKTACAYERVRKDAIRDGKAATS